MDNIDFYNISFDKSFMPALSEIPKFEIFNTLNKIDPEKDRQDINRAFDTGYLDLNSRFALDNNPSRFLICPNSELLSFIAEICGHKLTGADNIFFCGTWKTDTDTFEYHKKYPDLFCVQAIKTFADQLALAQNDRKLFTSIKELKAQIKNRVFSIFHSPTDHLGLERSVIISNWKKVCTYNNPDDKELFGYFQTIYTQLTDTLISAAFLNLANDFSGKIDLGRSCIANMIKCKNKP